MVLISVFVALTLTVSDVLSLQVCGRNLADLLDLVCDGRGFHWTSPDNVPRLTKRDAVSYLNNGRSTGVVNECCNKPCTISHLESYCAAGPDAYLPFPTPAPISEKDVRMLINGGRASGSMFGEVFRTSTQMAQTPPEPTTTQPPTTTTTAAPLTVVASLAGRPSHHVYRCRRIINGVRMPCFPSRFFYVRPIGPSPTRVPVL